MNVSPIPKTRIDKDHPKDQIIGDLNSAIQTRRMIKISNEHVMVCYINQQRRTNHKDYQNCLFTCFLSKKEPKKVFQALEYLSWIEGMHEELLQFKLQKVWTLVDLPNGERAIRTKWVFRNRKDERGIVVKNKARLMDVKSAFLYSTIEEEVYVCQPPGFEDPQFPDKVYKVEKALYGLHQAPRACTPIKTNKALVKDEEAEAIDVHLYRSMIGSLMYLTSSRPDIMFDVCACARFQVTPKTSHIHAVKRIFRYLKGQPKLGLWYPKDSPFDLEAFSDSDYAGASLDRKSTTGGCQFLGKRLISWQCKKQTIVANSTTEAEYVAAANCCGQVLWIQNQMLDYGFNFMNTKIYIDNESTICIVKNPVFHSKTKHIEIRHHFIRDSYEKKLIQVIKIHTDHNVADLLTKAFDVSSPTIYASYIEQFWNTTTSKTVNSVKQIHAIVDGKAVVITESSVRNDLLFDDEDGITCLTNEKFFENLTLMGILDPKKFLMYPRFLQLFLNNQLKDLPEPFNDTYETPSHTKKVFSNMARQSKSFSGKVTPLFESMLVQNQAPEGESSVTPPEPQPTPSTSQPNVLEPQTELLQTETPPTVSHEPQTEANIEQILPSPSIYQRKHKKTQKHRRAKKVTKLPQTSVPLDLRADEPNEPPLLEGHTSGSGEGRMEHTFEFMDIIPLTPHDSPLLGGYIPGSDEGRLKLKELMAMKVKSSDDDLYEEDASKQGRTSDKTKPMFKDSDFDDLDDLVDEGMDFVQEKDAKNQGKIGADDTEVVTQKQLILLTLVKMKEEKAKEKGVAIKDIKDSSRPIKSITTLQPLPNIDPKDKDKGILQETEPVEKTKKKVQGDAQIERDAEVALRLQAELDEELRVERERQEEASKVAIAKMFDEKQLAAERAEAIKNKPPTKTQLRNLMMTYLKNMGGYKRSQLKGKSYKEIQGLYERQQKRIQDFTPMDSEKEAQKSGKRLKRVAGSYATQNEVNYEPLSIKFPIVNWEYQLLGKMEEKDMYVYKLTRADGSSSYHGDIQAFLRRLDRQDLNDLYRLVQERFQDHPLEGHDLLLWGYLRMIFDPDEKDEL
ncbi:putative reverse transcriptase, RNA-dependent DNA polymerase [Tanacetum coccineum]